MRPEINIYIEKARQCLTNARLSLGYGLSNDAGRGAYIAAFHASQAFIFDRTGKRAKTHSGAGSEFARLAKEEPRIDKNFSTFLARAYKLKEVADYEYGPDSEIPLDLSKESIETAASFIDCISKILNDS